MREDEARRLVEHLHNRGLYTPPVGRAVMWGWGAFAVLYLIDRINLGIISPWAQLGIGLAVGVVVGLREARLNREMRAEVQALLSNSRPLG